MVVAHTVGAPFLMVATPTNGRNRQLSDDLQASCESDFLTAPNSAITTEVDGSFAGVVGRQDLRQARTSSPYIWLASHVP
ncbi:hypothetical protein JI59_17295 [Novosphingobium pentaromativorans US6-1]|nr:hypothetical protein JI59_17295 [Novosphingobium pentaromativorans US6-1]